MQALSDYENWRDGLHDSPRPEPGPDERSIRYFSHDYTADTKLEYTRTGQRAELSLSFSSEDPDMGTEEMVYAGESSESMSELVSDLREELTDYLDRLDTSAVPADDGLTPPEDGQGLDVYFDSFSKTSLYAFEGALLEMEHEHLQNLPWKPIQPDQIDWLYSSDEKTDVERGCVCHVRGDFGPLGNEFWSSRFDHQPWLSTSAFSAELRDVLIGLRSNGHLLNNFDTMSRMCKRGQPCDASFGFHAETKHYDYCLRCTPRHGDYNFYLYAYDKDARREQALKRTAEKTDLLLADAVQPDKHPSKKKGMER